MLEGIFYVLLHNFRSVVESFCRTEGPTCLLESIYWYVFTFPRRLYREIVAVGWEKDRLVTTDVLHF